MKTIFQSIALLLIGFILFTSMEWTTNAQNGNNKVAALIDHRADKMLIYEPGTDQVVIIQYTKPLGISDVYLESASRDRVVLMDIKTRERHRISIGEDVVGISVIANIPAIAKLVRKNGSTMSLVAPTLDEIYGMSCKCNEVGSEANPDDCDSGGEGSTSCETSVSGGVSVLGNGGTVSSHCQVGCGAGYYACCITR